MKRAEFYGAFLTAIAVVSFPTAGRGAASVVGHVMTEPILGQPHAGYWHEYESYAFLHPEGAVGGKSIRVGSGGSNGKFSFLGLNTTPNYSLVSFQPTFFNGVPSMIDRIRFRDGKNAPLVLNDPEYACGNSDLGQWGSDPWTAASRDFYQTFIARSTSVRRITARLADNRSGKHATLGIVADNGGSISTWPYVTAVGGSNPRQITLPGSSADFHISWRSGQVPLTAGLQYAVKIHAVDFTGFSPYVHKSEQSRPHVGYEGGCVWTDGTKHATWDMLGIVEGDADGKLATMAPTAHYGYSFSGDTHNRFGQSWIAKGVGLAAVTLGVIVADPVNQRIFTLRVYDGPAKTTQIGPEKTVPGAWLVVANTAAIGFGYCPGEVNLTPGRQYYFELSCSTPFQVDTLKDESYPDGQAYYNGVAKSTDMACHLMEYQQIVPEIESPTVVSTTNWLTNPGFESYTGTPVAIDTSHFPTGIKPDDWTVTHDDANKNQEWAGSGGSMTPGWNTVNALMRGQDEGGGYIGYMQAGTFNGRVAEAFRASLRIAGEAGNVGGETSQMYEEALRFRLNLRFLRGATLLETKSTGWVGFWGAEEQFVTLELSDYVTTGATDYEYEIEAVDYIPNRNGFPGEMNTIAIDDAFLTFDLADEATAGRNWQRLR